MWMRALRVAVVVGLVVPSAGRPQPVPKPFPAANAVDLIGRRASIEGTVMGVRVLNGYVWLDLERKFPRQAMSVVVPERTAKTSERLKRYQGRRIVVTGLVERFLASLVVG